MGPRSRLKSFVFRLFVRVLHCTNARVSAKCGVGACHRHSTSLRSPQLRTRSSHVLQRFFPCLRDFDHSIFAPSSTTRTSRNTPSAAGHGNAPPRNPFVACVRLYPCSVALRKEGREEGSISPKFAGCQLSSFARPWDPPFHRA